jgi:hypothetical protein
MWVWWAPPGTSFVTVRSQFDGPAEAWHDGSVIPGAARTLPAAARGWSRLSWPYQPFPRGRSRPFAQDRGTERRQFRRVQDGAGDRAEGASSERASTMRDSRLRGRFNGPPGTTMGRIPGDVAISRA